MCIVGLIFLRYISGAFEKQYRELVEDGNGFEDERDVYAMDNVFCLRSGLVENNSVCGACSRNRGSDRRCNAGYQSGKQVVEERTS